MPKVNLARDPRAERAASMRRTINAKRGMRDIASQTELARRIGMRAGTLSAKMRSGAWTAEDLAALDKVLRFSAEELAALCEKLGAFYKPEQIGIDPALSEDMLSVSAAIRNRLTLIRMRRVLDFGE